MGCRDDPRHVVLDDQGDAVTDHADTIRPTIRHDDQHPSTCPGCAADRALDALLAENQRLREALTSAIREWEAWMEGAQRDYDDETPQPDDWALLKEVREALAGDAE